MQTIARPEKGQDRSCLSEREIRGKRLKGSREGERQKGDSGQAFNIKVAVGDNGGHMEGQWGIGSSGCGE